MMPGGHSIQKDFTSLIEFREGYRSVPRDQPHLCTDNIEVNGPVPPDWLTQSCQISILTGCLQISICCMGRRWFSIRVRRPETLSQLLSTPMLLLVKGR